MKIHCGTCGKLLVQEPGESIANRRRRKTCATSACRKPFRAKSQHKYNQRKKEENAAKPKRAHRFNGKVTEAFKYFLSGARHGTAR